MGHDYSTARPIKLIHHRLGLLGIEDVVMSKAKALVYSGIRTEAGLSSAPYQILRLAGLTDIECARIFTWRPSPPKQAYVE